VLIEALQRQPRARFALLPTPIHRLERLTAHLGGPEIWIKRDDLTGLAGGGNKTRKLEFLVGDALRSGADTLVTVGALQSNHTRQTAAAAARVGLSCVLLHNGWAPEAGPFYRQTGNVLLSGILGAELVVDATQRSVGDEGELEALVQRLVDEGRRPYLIPGGASDHPLGGLGYAACAAEIDLHFDCVVHCTGSGGTQAGLLAGLAALGHPARVIGVSDDDETAEKRERVLRLGNATLELLGEPRRLSEADVEVVASDPNPYGVAGPETLAAIRLFARTEGLIADPVYEGKAIRGLIELIQQGRIGRSERVLLMHLGGTHAVHAYANQLWEGDPLLDSREQSPQLVRPRDRHDHAAGAIDGHAGRAG
jgi:1-aminocyclopropane-1-carboxylate deaminase